MDTNTRKTTVYTVHELIRELGGTAKTARFFEQSIATVSNWERRSNRLPVEKYMEHQKQLEDFGILAHPGIWFPHLRDKIVVKTASGWRL